jgi:TPR repeat protein
MKNLLKVVSKFGAAVARRRKTQPPRCHSSYGLRVLTIAILLAGGTAFMWGDGASAQTAPVLVATNLSAQWLPLKAVLEKWEKISVEEITAKANAGDLTARHYLGYCYAEGIRFPQDSARGVDWYQRAGESGYLPSWSNLGFLYQRGKGVPQDFSKAMQYYRRAADGGFSSGSANIGILYRDGLGVKRDFAEAVKWFQRAAALDHNTAMVELGRSYRFGRGIAKDLTVAEKWFRWVADKGDRLGQANLAALCEEKGDYAAALKYYRLAAEQEDADAMVQLYLLHWRGEEVPQDRAEAMRWLSQAAHKSHPYAECLLGYRFQNPVWEGTGTNRHLPRPNFSEAVKWFRRSAEQNWAGGQYYLALGYLNGEGLEQNEETGLEWLRKAADQNHHHALHKLAMLYTRNIGEPRGPEDRPVALLLRAAGYEHTEAYEQLAFRYRHGLGVGRDLVAAAQWYCRAASADYMRTGQGDPVFVKTVGKPEPTDSFLIVLSIYTEATKRNAQALATIGSFYQEGQHAPVDLDKAWVWYELARKNGGAANAEINQIKAQLNAAQLETARQQIQVIEKELNQDRIAIRALAEATQ